MYNVHCTSLYSILYFGRGAANQRIRKIIFIFSNFNVHYSAICILHVRGTHTHTLPKYIIWKINVYVVWNNKREKRNMVVAGCWHAAGAGTTWSPLKAKRHPSVDVMCFWRGIQYWMLCNRTECYGKIDDGFHVERKKQLIWDVRCSFSSRKWQQKNWIGQPLNLFSSTHICEFHYRKHFGKLNRQQKSKNMWKLVEQLEQQLLFDLSSWKRMDNFIKRKVYTVQRAIS